MVIVKTTPELSDKDAYYWGGKSPTDFANFIQELPDDEIMLCGEDAVQMATGQSLLHVLGTRSRIGNKLVTYNYLFSEQMKVKGRSNAYNIIAGNRELLLTNHESRELVEDDLDEVCAFDVETGGSTGVRCITFFDGYKYRWVDCRDLKSNKTKKKLLTKLFTGTHKWIVHNFAHDCKQVMKLLKVPFFECYADTITFTKELEYRNLGYLSGVVLGVPRYKDMLEIANERKDFGMLVDYCKMDSFCTYHLHRKLRLTDSRFVNQFIHTMLFPPELEMTDTIYDVFPDMKGMGKSQLKQQLGRVGGKYARLLLKTINPPKPTITLHSADGFNVKIPDEVTFKGDLYFKSSSGLTDIREIMANDIHFDSAELSVYRFTHNIEPKKWIPVYDIDPRDVFLVNDVVCLTRKPIEGFTKCDFDQVRGLFYGR